LHPLKHFNVYAGTIVVAEALTTNTYQDFSLDWPFGGHVLPFTNEQVPVVSTYILRDEFPQFAPCPTGFAPFFTSSEDGAGSWSC
jgi:hypothetical protein